MFPRTSLTGNEPIFVFAGLVFIGVIKFGGKWYDDSHPGWFGGHWWWVAVAAVSAVSLIGGASLGPEKALGTMGGGAGSWMARRRGLGEEDSQVNTLAGLGVLAAGVQSAILSTDLRCILTPKG